MPNSNRQQVRALIGGLNRLTERVVIKITLDVTANLTETTPVDTGWARANWVPAVGQRNRGSALRADTQLAREVRASFVPAAVAGQAAGQAQVAGYKLERGRVFVSTNVPYILRLNDGYSQQAPRGFVQNAVRKAVTQDIRGFRG